MMLPTYNFAMSVSKFFDDHEVKKLCAQELKSIYVNCSKACECLGLPRSLNTAYSFPEFTLRLCGGDKTGMSCSGTWSVKTAVLSSLVYSLPPSSHLSLIQKLGRISSYLEKTSILLNLPYLRLISYFQYITSIFTVCM